MERVEKSPSQAVGRTGQREREYKPHVPTFYVVLSRKEEGVGREEEEGGGGWGGEGGGWRGREGRGRHVITVHFPVKTRLVFSLICRRNVSHRVAADTL